MATSKIKNLSFFFRLGTSEVEQVQSVIDGVETLIKMEKALEAKKPITELIPAETTKIKQVSWKAVDKRLGLSCIIHRICSRTNEIFFYFTFSLIQRRKIIQISILNLMTCNF